MSPAPRRTLSNHLVLLAGAGAIVLWGCGASLQPPSGAGGAGGAGIPGGAAGASAPWVPGPCVEPAADAALARFQTGMIGSWLGTATTPGWGWPRATVEFTFFCDRHYHSDCLAAEGAYPELCVSLYSGTDADHPLKTYEVFDVRSDGKATGIIYVAFPEDNNARLNDLRAIDLSAAGDRLVFDFFSTPTGGPIHYELQRQP